MAVSDKDRELMVKVAEYFESTKKSDLKYKAKKKDSRSINDTALHFNISRSKATKMLITMGVYRTPLSDEIQRMRADGLNVKQIAEKLNISISMVSSNLPYENEIHGGFEVSDHAKQMREYRAYERMQRKKQAQKKEEKKGKDMSEDWKKDLDSKLSFTVTDSRRVRLTHAMVRESEEYKRIMSLSEGKKSARDAKQKRDRLRAKDVLTFDEMLDLGEFDGALYDRNVLDLEEIYGEQLPFEPREMIRLHLELMADFNEEQKRILHQYGLMEADTISRDILVSDDLPLYALHYVIQRAFGWQNCHLHRFYLSDKRVEEFTQSVKQWMDQVGVIYRSPLMDEYAEFWADDYERGSFKNWLRKKYTGPCVSQCWGEDLIACREDMKQLNPDEEYYVQYRTYRNTKEEKPMFCYPVIGRDGKRNDPPKSFIDDDK